MNSIIKLTFYILLLPTTLSGCKKAEPTPPNYNPGEQIIADHTVVDRYDDIPQRWIDSVKKMFVTVPGESHSQAYRAGLWQLEQLKPKYSVNITESGTPEPYTVSHLRISKVTWGDYDHATGWIYSCEPHDWGGGGPPSYIYNPTQVARVQAGIAYAHAHNLTYSAMGYGFCYNDGWYESYVTATQALMDYCIENELPTKIFFTTGPVDGYMALADETSYQNSLRWVYIRDHVAADDERILFDYADILCYNDAGEKYTRTWNGHTFPVIHPDNMDDYGVYYPAGHGHIGPNGCLRIGKAMWWMLARMAGWDGK